MVRCFMLKSSPTNIKFINAKIDSLSYNYRINPLSSNNKCQPFIYASVNKGHHHHQTKGFKRLFIRQQLKNLEQLKTQNISKKAVDCSQEKRGSVAGAVALIIGTSVGSGILALPQKISPAGIIPSSMTMIICWGALLVEALLLAEINVGLLRKRRKRKGSPINLEAISIRTMAQETLGVQGGTVAACIYVFLGYSSMVAYCSKSGEILGHLLDFPASVSSTCFTGLFTILVAVGGTQTTDRVNQSLTVMMISLLVAIEVVALAFGGSEGLHGYGNWEKVSDTIPVMIFALVYHDIIPVICAYLGGDIVRIRKSIAVGSLVPLLALLVWDAIALGLSAQSDGVSDPVEVLFRIKWGGMPFMVETFSLLAVGTSIIGTLLGLSEFLKEQLRQLSWNSQSEVEKVEQPNYLALSKWWSGNKIGAEATALVVVPSLLVSLTVPDAFSVATDFAGGYCMTMLYGILPPAMVLAMNKNGDSIEQTSLLKSKPAVLGIGAMASFLVIEQVLQGLYEFHP